MKNEKTGTGSPPLIKTGVYNQANNSSQTNGKTSKLMSPAVLQLCTNKEENIEMMRRRWREVRPEEQKSKGRGGRKNEKKSDSRYRT